MQMPQKPLIRLTAAAMLVSLSACGGQSGSPSPAASATTPSGAVATALASAAAAPSDSPPGARTCGLLAQAVERATLMQPGIVAAIQTASATADAPVADAAQRL